MKVQVRFRFNKVTGEVEEFLIDDHESNLSPAEHNRQHDRIANQVGCVIAQHPRIQEISSATVVTQTITEQQTEPSETEQTNHTTLTQQQS